MTDSLSCRVGQKRHTALHVTHRTSMRTAVPRLAARGIVSLHPRQRNIAHRLSLSLTGALARVHRQHAADPTTQRRLRRSAQRGCYCFPARQFSCSDGLLALTQRAVENAARSAPAHGGACSAEGGDGAGRGACQHVAGSIGCSGRALHKRVHMKCVSAALWTHMNTRPPTMLPSVTGIRLLVMKWLKLMSAPSAMPSGTALIDTQRKWHMSVSVR